ncbi:Carboxypeptidase S [Sparassis crispa]|uniref:Carboxypeptidase S n=1 Tax=Sparassis crispa TaxID=139825 RepID=A0A401GTG5_9APHY|nr:Carboxypeptidase S [Sparassis crispa]GBE85034.1 Carboxypeptidase S [Sparassis crispa]
MARRVATFNVVCVALAVVCLFILAPTCGLTGLFREHILASESFNPDALSTVCPQTSPISPFGHSALLAALEEEYATTDFQLEAYESLGGAIRIPTVAYDDLKPPGQDSRWEIFSELHAYLKTRFPLVHTRLLKEEVNVYALVYHWQGTDDSLKPMLLTAHQDVVPVEPLTLDSWVHPPFSGLYDGEWIWGRGSCDDKPGLIGSLTAIEKLLEKGFQPTRTVVLAYGIDEERGGISGATAIRDYLLVTYGENAFSILVDEGGGYSEENGVMIASPSVAEKGKFDVHMEITTPGGHSSIPPPHTSIGILAALIKQIEVNPHTPQIRRNATYYQSLQCRAAYDPGLPKKIRQLVRKSTKDDKALRALEAELAHTDRSFGAMAGTTQAVDIIHGGVKTNALPENAFLIMNHRIDLSSSVADLKARVANVVVPLAQSFNLSVDAFGVQYGDVERGAAFGHLAISDAFGTALEPAPVTPTVGSRPYELLSGTIMGALGSSNRTGYTDKVFIAPGMSTDTKHYWKLTRHIFRYGHMNHADLYNGAHTINEASRAEGFLEVIRFFTWLILNGDESSLLE